MNQELIVNMVSFKEKLQKKKIPQQWVNYFNLELEERCSSAFCWLFLPTLLAGAVWLFICRIFGKNDWISGWNVLAFSGNLRFFILFRPQNTPRNERKNSGGDCSIMGKSTRLTGYI